MTNSGTSPVTRETLALQFERSKRRPVIVRIEGAALKLRLKGTRSWYTVAVSSVFALAIKIAAEERKRARKAARLAKRSGRP